MYLRNLALTTLLFLNQQVLANGLYLGKDDKRTLEDLHILFGNQPIH